MKVVLLSTRRLRAHMVDAVRDDLGLEPSDTSHLSVVSWNPPIGRLRVAQHLVVGPVLSPAGRVRYARVEAPLAEGADPVDADALDDSREGELEDAVDDVLTPPERSGAGRVLHALRWRVNRVRLTVKRHPTAQRLSGSTKVRRMRHALTPGGLATHFALGCTQSEAVRRAVAGADLVVALDQSSHRAAWLLARRVAGPEVVVGVAAGARIVALHRDGGLS